METSISEAPPSLPAWQAFALPGLAAEIPMIITVGGDHDVLAAKFILASEDAGVPLPTNTKGSLLEVLGRQWQQYIQSKTSDLNRDYRGVEMSIVLGAETLALSLRTEEVVRTYRVKPLVQRLERIKPGLGWYVYHLIGGIYSRGLHYMDMGWYSWFTDRYGSCPETDEELAQAILEEQFYDETDYLPFDVKRMEEYKEALSDFMPAWPSDVIKAVDGHAHLAGLSKGKGIKVKPKNLTKTAFKRLAADKTLPRKVREALNAAKALEAQIDKIEAGVLTPEDGDRVPLFLLAWNQPHIMWNIANSMLDDSMNGGVLEYDLAIQKVTADSTQSDLKAMAMNFINLIDLYRATLKLLEHFEPIEV
jgi:PRTRC genetic system protein F